MNDETDALHEFLAKGATRRGEHRPDDSAEMARELLISIRSSLDRREPLSPPLRDYLSNAITAIIDRNASADDAFGLVRAAHRHASESERHAGIAAVLILAQRAGKQRDAQAALNAAGVTPGTRQRQAIRKAHAPMEGMDSDLLRHYVIEDLLPTIRPGMRRKVVDLTSP